MGLVLVPCGIPKGTEPHSETHPSQSLILCEQSDKKSIIQLMTLGAMSSTLNLLIKILFGRYAIEVRVCIYNVSAGLIQRLTALQLQDTTELKVTK